MEPLIVAGSAFLLGALHGLEPGHGKTVMAAYLVGSRGDVRHAVLLGAIVTFTHTFSIILMGILAVVATAYFVPQQIEHVLEMVSGLLVTAVGGWMFYTRALRGGRSPSEHHAHGHTHDHGHSSAEEDDHEHGHHHHARGEDGHSHDLPADGFSLRGLVAMGVSGGMVPCPAALATLLAAVALGNIAGGLALVVVFSLGLAAVLICIGIGLLKAAGLASRLFDGNKRFMTWSGAISSLVVLVLGLTLTIRAVIDVAG